MSVGTDHDTAAFAVAAIRRWWQSAGAHTYPTASRLLITADGGGFNGYRTRLWKTGLAALATETGLVITVCHLPPAVLKGSLAERDVITHERLVSPVVWDRKRNPVRDRGTRARSVRGRGLR